MSEDIKKDQKEPDVYLKNFRLLEEAAQQLSNQDTPDIDKIMPAVQQGTEAYKACMARIEQVEKMLEEFNQKNS